MPILKKCLFMFLVVAILFESHPSHAGLAGVAKTVAGKRKREYRFENIFDRRGGLLKRSNLNVDELCKLAEHHGCLIDE
ncbi:hypothetical protein AC249_AIPGENE9557 [Exaiptasia diaphana]|nr:hypothetical protein AC249_AIPGENE9557 [Exaiptasia diaphana]